MLLLCCKNMYSFRITVSFRPSYPCLFPPCVPYPSVFSLAGGGLGRAPSLVYTILHADYALQYTTVPRTQLDLLSTHTHLSTLTLCFFVAFSALRLAAPYVFLIITFTLFLPLSVFIPIARWRLYFYFYISLPYPYTTLSALRILEEEEDRSTCT